MIRLQIPATSANIGSGFDSLGIALKLYNYIDMEEYDGVDIASLDAVTVPSGENNLIYKTAKQVYALCGRPFKGLKIRQQNNIPMTRGLGSSSACIVGGVMGANALMGSPLSLDEMVDIAAKMEGHPDNSTPAFLGGFVASVFDGEHVTHMKCDLGQDLKFACFIPSFELRTEKARAALPKQVLHKDAVFNLSRAALLALSLSQRKYENLKVACQDALHQPYRLKMIERAPEVFALANDLGAYATFISGAGPTLLSIFDSKDASFAQKAAECLKKQGLDAYKLHILEVDNKGAAIV